MSYEIIYDKQFIKIKDNLFIPLVLSGSNNCTELSINGRERRTRSWYPLNIKKGIFSTKEEMLKHCEDERERIKKNYENSDYGDYTDERFGSWSGLAIGSTTNKVSYGRYKGIFITGCKKSLTVEELLAVNISVRLYTYDYSNNENKMDNISIYPKTSDELYNEYYNILKKIKGTNAYISATLSSEAEYKMSKIRNYYFPRKKSLKPLISVNESYWTLKIKGTSRYLIRRIKGGYKYSYFTHSLRYLTEKEALKKVKSLKNLELETEYIEHK